MKFNPSGALHRAFVVSALLFTIVMPCARAEISRTSEIIYETNPAKKIADLKWTTPAKMTVGYRSVSYDKIELFIHLTGSYMRDDYAGAINSVSLPRDELKNFNVEVIIQSESQPVTFTAIGPRGDIQSEQVVIKTPQYAMLKAMATEMPKRRLFFGAALGVTSINYSETGKLTHNEVATTVRLSANYILSKKWEWNASTYYNAFILSSNQADQIQFWGVNGRVGYVVHNTFSKWKFVYNAGWYYVTSFATDMGFINLSGPQVFPMIRYNVSEAGTLYWYAKYSPISDKFALLKLNNRELAAGMGFVFPINKRQYSISIDVANLQATIPNATETDTSKIDLTTASASFGLSF